METPAAARDRGASANRGDGYGAAVLYLVSQETRLVFQAGRTLSDSRPTFPYAQIDVPRTDTVRQFAWMMPAAPPANDGPWVLFLHGNAATIAAKVNIAHYTELRKLGLNVMAPGLPRVRRAGRAADRGGARGRRAGGVRLPANRATGSRVARGDLRVVAGIRGRGDAGITRRIGRADR